MGVPALTCSSLSLRRFCRSSISASARVRSLAACAAFLLNLSVFCSSSHSQVNFLSYLSLLFTMTHTHAFFDVIESQPTTPRSLKTCLLLNLITLFCLLLFLLFQQQVTHFYFLLLKFLFLASRYPVLLVFLISL